MFILFIYHTMPSVCVCVGGGGAGRIPTNKKKKNSVKIKNNLSTSANQVAFGYVIASFIQ